MSGFATSAMVDLQALDKSYGATRIVDEVTLCVGRGELVALLGPSGCGKTTTLRMVAGFIRPDTGRVLIGGRDVTDVSPHRRDTGMVFQSYALFPHLSVADNMAFGLRRRGVKRAEIATRIARMADLLRLDTLLDRLPKQLSGGQQQRVAVGRALVINPAVTLLDEPFSNLDAQLRESTRSEMRRIQQELHLTALMVTHDQAEAMAVADRLAIMHQGRIVQLDTPLEVYARPRTRFVAAFIGRANLFEVAGVGQRTPADGVVRSRSGIPFQLPGPYDGRGSLVLRPENIVLDEAAPSGPNSVAGTLVSITFLGSSVQATVRTDRGEDVLVEGSVELTRHFVPGQSVTARWAASAISVTED